MSSLERIVVGNIEMEWHAESRLAVLRFTRNVHPSGKEAALLIEALTTWIGMDGRAFGLLGDGEKLRGVDSEYRLLWGAFFKQHRGECYVAFFNMKPAVRVAAGMFRIGTGIRLNTFALETDARSWLRLKGIPA